MYDHKIIQENIKNCKTVGIKFIEPNIEKNKAKMSEIDEIVANVFRETGKQNLSKKKVLIIGGPTAESVDDVRIVTNRSSGKTAVLLAKSAFYQGADVELWYGRGFEPAPDWIKRIDYLSLSDLSKLVKTKKLQKFDIIIICAALSDYIPKKQGGKIPSGKDKLILEMKPAPKIISVLRQKAPKAVIIGFKVEGKKETLKNKSMELLKNNKLDFVIGNTIAGFSSDENEIWLFDKKGKIVHKKEKKESLVDIILDTIK
jgi:phosphopantothenoylcysteine decarboxylase/phosphopantothenate--cysteine ligase